MLPEVKDRDLSEVLGEGFAELVAVLGYDAFEGHGVVSQPYYTLPLDGSGDEEGGTT